MSEHVTLVELEDAQVWYQQTNELLDLELSDDAKRHIEAAFRAVRVHASHLSSCHGVEGVGPQ